MPAFESNQQKMAYSQFGSGETVFLWAHGWGQNRSAMEHLAHSLAPLGTHILIDFPGFGESPQPATDWTISDYATYLHEFLGSLAAKRIIWIGHSFGCRVGIKLASLFPRTLHQLVLLAAPGLPRARPLHKSVYFHLRLRLFKTLKILLWRDAWKEKCRHIFSSADFNNAGSMKHIFMNSIRDVLAEDAAKITCPVLVLCGAQDTETPPDISMRYSQLIPRAQLRIFDGCDHYSILTTPLVSYNIKVFCSS